MTKIFIGRLQSNTKEADIEHHFKKFGPIKRLDFKTGYAFIEYENDLDAVDAINEMNGSIIDESTIVVEEAKGKRDNHDKPTFRKTGFRVTVEGITKDTSWQDLKDFGRKAGTPIYSNIEVDHNGDKCGLIEFETYDDMENALRTLDRQELHGKSVRVFKQEVKGEGLDNGAVGGNYGGRGAYDNGGRQFGGGGYHQDSRDRRRDDYGDRRRDNYGDDRGNRRHVDYAPDGRRDDYGDDRGDRRRDDYEYRGPPARFDERRNDHDGGYGYRGSSGGGGGGGGDWGRGRADSRDRDRDVGYRQPERAPAPVPLRGGGGGRDDRDRGYERDVPFVPPAGRRISDRDNRVRDRSGERDHRGALPPVEDAGSAWGPGPDYVSGAVPGIGGAYGGRGGGKRSRSRSRDRGGPSVGTRGGFNGRGGRRR